VLDEHTAMLAQPVLAKFIDDGHFGAHVRRMRRLYAGRQEALLEAARRHLDGLLEIRADEAGMHLIAWHGAALNGVMDDQRAARAAADAGIAATALSASYVGKPSRQGLMLGYAAHDETAIADASRRLAAVIAASAGK
jgi:GntR family transcriptional regulator/MocR family aminotransferase